MKKTLKIEKEHEVLSLINDIAFTCVPAWYGATTVSYTHLTLPTISHV